MKVEKYYTAVPSLIKRTQTVGRRMPFCAKDTEEYEIWAAKLRGNLSGCIGLDKMVRCGLQVQELERVTVDGGLTRVKMVINTEPDVQMPFYMFLPADFGGGKKYPAVICCHGHGSAGKAVVAGIAVTDEIKSSIAGFNYDYGVQIAKTGCVTFCPDARGFGERRERQNWGDGPDKYMNGSCHILNAIASTIGQSVAGMWVWDLMRLIDYIETLDFCVSGKTACVGLSGGGLQTLWLTAMDKRVCACIVSGYYYGFKESLIDLFNCDCNYQPGVWEHIDVGELGALIAPRPMVIETGTEDPLNGASKLENVEPYVEIARGAYRLFEAENNLLHDIFEGGHLWHGTVSVEFLLEALK